MKRAALYLRVSTVDQHPETQRLELLRLAEQRGFEIIEEYVDQGVSGSRVRRLALDKMMADAQKGRFDVIVVWAADRLARSVKHFLELLDEFDRLKIEFVSLRESLDTGGPLGRAVMVIVGAIAELERSLIRERVCAGLRRAKLEGRRIGRPRLILNEEEIRRDRARGCSLGQIARAHRISRTSVVRVLQGSVPKPLP
jgi:DNA invertase Pin-like site-specific DNA recombinase